MTDSFLREHEKISNLSHHFINLTKKLNKSKQHLCILSFHFWIVFNYLCREHLVNVQPNIFSLFKLFRNALKFFCIETLHCCLLHAVRKLGWLYCYCILSFDFISTFYLLFKSLFKNQIYLCFRCRMWCNCKCNFSSICW